ncbi:ABC transporter substrate-binding protein [Acidisphaera sp. L21]|uniref:ABC transporter substrate-binding protein n=1 Tax=Acidisphaera sp. L21 TaxID=1641851 RepID=UPI0020B10AEC|nr:ABC transporter substrate-binding protein [Acidisphaera sp. L21]
MMRTPISRRSTLLGTLAVGATALARQAIAQEGPIRLGALVPLTGAGGPYGPNMAKAAKLVVDQVNAAGGILGRKLELTVVDDQSNPDAGVRAARQLIEVNKVAAIIGTWASSVTTAVAPLCWESKTFLTTTSGADSITLLPHDGYLIRTQPNTMLQGQKFGQFALEKGGKKVFFLSPQTPFFQSEMDAITKVVKAAGGDTASLVYDDQKPSYRSEIDTMLRYAPDALILGGYTPDTIVVLKDLFRAGFKGAKIGFGYAINQKLLDSVPASVAEGCYTLAPSPAEGSAAYTGLVKAIGIANPDPYTIQVYDQTNLVVLAMAQGGEATGTGIRNNVRKVSQAPGGAVVVNALDGLKAIAAKQAIAYDGASGPCKFTDRGDIQDSKFRYEQVQGGKITLLKID